MDGASTFTRVNASNCERSYRVEAAALFSGVRSGQFTLYGLFFQAPPAGTEAKEVTIVNDAATPDDARSFALANETDIIDSILDWSKISMDGGPTAVILNKQTVNIHVRDVDGADIQNVTVNCDDKDGTSVFSVSTDVNGDIAEQQVKHQTKETNEATTEHGPHVFTITKAGYEPVIIENVVLSAAIAWDITLPNPVGAIAQPWR